eukprot:gene7892-biopygen1185
MPTLSGDYDDAQRRVIFDQRARYRMLGCLARLRECERDCDGRIVKVRAGCDARAALHEAVGGPNNVPVPPLTPALAPSSPPASTSFLPVRPHPSADDAPPRPTYQVAGDHPPHSPRSKCRKLIECAPMKAHGSEKSRAIRRWPDTPAARRSRRTMRADRTVERPARRRSSARSTPPAGRSTARGDAAPLPRRRNAMGGGARRARAAETRWEVGRGVPVRPKRDGRWGAACPCGRAAAAAAAVKPASSRLWPHRVGAPAWARAP